MGFNFEKNKERKTKQSHTKLAVKVLVSKFRVNCTEMINTGELF